MSLRYTGMLPVVVALAAATTLYARDLLTQDAALALAFPDSVRVERRTAYLEDTDLARARELAGDDVDIDQGVVTYYLGLRGDRPVGAAYFDAHRVRTKNEVLMIVVDPDSTASRVEVMKFTEPLDYRAPGGWIDQLLHRKLDDNLTLRGDIDNLTGATLTARAMTRATRRVLALHAVIDPFAREVRQ